MTVSTTSNRVQYNGDGATTVFAFPYKFLATSDLRVYVGGVLQTLTTNYSVGTPSDTGANVTMVSAPAVGVANVVILNNPDVLQSTALPSNGTFPSTAVERMSDKLTLLVQRFLDLVSRSIGLNDGDAVATTTLPLAASRASKVLGFDASGNVSMYSPSSAVADASTVNFLPSGTAGTGAVSRTVAAVLTERFQLTNYLQASDTDLTSAFTRALAAISNNGRIIIPDRNDLPNVTTGNILLPNNKRVWIEGDGYRLVNAGANFAFKINNSAVNTYSTKDEVRHVIEGIIGVANTTGQGGLIQISDANSQTLRNLVAIGFNKGIELKNQRFWTEQSMLELIDLFNCNFGIYHDAGFQFDGSNGAVVVLATDRITCAAHPWTTGDAAVYNVGSGTAITPLVAGTTYYVIVVDANTIKLATSNANALAGTAIDLTVLGTGTTHKLGMMSQATTHYRRVTVGSMAGAASATPVGVNITTNTSIYRSNINELNIFPDKTNAIGFYSDGDTAAINGAICVENTVAAATGVKAFMFDTSASGGWMDVLADVRGTIATKLQVVSAATALQGLVIANFGDGNGSMRKSGALSYIEAIYDTAGNLSFERRVSTGDVPQFGANPTNPSEVRRTTDWTKYGEWRHCLTGNGTPTTFTSGTTQDVTGLDHIVMNYAAGATITTFTGGTEGQVLNIVWLTANGTLTHANVADQFMLAGSVNFVPTTQARMTLRRYNGRWYEYSRTAA